MLQGHQKLFCARGYNGALAGAREQVAQIGFPDDGVVHLSQYDAMDRTVRTEEYRLQDGEMQLSTALGELPAGVYFVALEGSSCSATARVLKIGDRTTGEPNTFFESLRRSVHGDVPPLPLALSLPR